MPFKRSRKTYDGEALYEYAVERWQKSPIHAKQQLGWGGRLVGSSRAGALELRCDLEHRPVAVSAAIGGRAVEIAGGIEDQAGDGD